MIFDKIENSGNYNGLNKGIDAAFKFLQETDLLNLENGKHEIDGDRVFAICMEYETKSAEISKNEGHRKFIDVQYIISGNEKMHCHPINGLEIVEEYNAENDALFYEKKANSIITVTAGDFAVFYPEDSHMPGVSLNHEPGKVKKVVVKVHV